MNYAIGKPKLLAIISEVNSSPQLLSIFAEASKCGFKLNIIVIGINTSRILLDLESLGLPVFRLEPKSKFKSAPLFVKVSLKILLEKPDIFFASGQFATIIGLMSAKILRVKRRVFIRHHSVFHKQNNMHFAAFIDKMCNYLATNIVAVSELVEKILTLDEGARSNKVVLIKNGIDTSLFYKDPNSITPITLEKPTLRIGMISRFTELKGIEYAASAFIKIHREYPHVTFHVVGKFADSYSKVLNILRQAPPSSFKLEESCDSVPEFFEQIDTFVHVPVGVEEESFGLVYIEALASGVNCIFTISGILNEISDIEKYADIVGHKNSEDIYSALKSRIECRYSNTMPMPREKLEEFSIQRMTRSYIDLFLDRSVYDTR